MPIFEQTMRRPDFSKADTALRTMYDHIRYLQEQLEFTLTSLDSSNIIEISTDVTSITSSDGAATISGDKIELQGKSNERFTVGNDTATGRFQFELRDGGGQAMYLSGRELVITKRVRKSVDGGTW